MFLSSKVSVKKIVKYRPDDAYSALLSAFKRSEICSLTSSDKTERTISAKTESSWKTWGEKVTASVIPSGEKSSEITITSSLKHGLFDWGKNQKNIDDILDLLSYTLEDYEKTEK